MKETINIVLSEKSIWKAYILYDTRYSRNSAKGTIIDSIKVRRGETG